MKPLHKLIASMVLCSMQGLAGLAQTAPNISYQTPVQYSQGVTIMPLTPSNSGGAPVINGQTSLLAGSLTAGYVDGTGSGASFNQPLGAVVDALGNVYVTDVGNERIRKISPSGTVSTFAGNGTPGSGNGTGTSATFYHPVGMCIDAAGNIYVADEDNNMIRKMTPAGVVTTIAGQTGSGYVDGASSVAKFNLPCGVAVDASGNVYVADYNNNVIRKVTAAGTVSTFAGSGAVGSANGTGTSASFNHPFSVAIDGLGNLYVADRLNNMIRMITPAGVVSTLAGQAAAGYADGTGSTAKFNLPTSLIADKLGNVYVADETNNRIRKIVVATGVVSTLAGTGATGSAAGLGSASTFYNPFGITIDSSNTLYVCDDGNNMVRKIISTPYTITPSLPAGLAFNPSSGVISGAPAAVMAATNYTVTAYSNISNSIATVNITVDPASINFSAGMNAVVTYTPRISGLTTSAALQSASANNTLVETNIQYVDGLGRPLQTVQYQESPTGKDVVQPFTYDQLGRDSVDYLPYSVAASSGGAYESNALTGTGGYTGGGQYQFYQQTGKGYVNTTYPYAGTAYEPSPLNRVVEKGAPGTSWQLSGSGVTGAGHTVKIVYTQNNSISFAADSVNGMQVANYYATINGDNTRTLNVNGYYQAGTLYVTVSKDENWVSGRAGTVEEYKDLNARVVLKRQYNYSPYNGVTTLQVLSTYYVYDDFGELAFVLSPQANGDADVVPSTTTLNNLCYQYRYDAKHRQIAKKLPGKGWQYMVYNTIDEPVATQDTLQRANKQWLFTKYDVMGRPVMTGTWNNNNVAISLAALQANLSPATTDLWETPSNTTNGYNGVAWPKTYVVDTLTLDYYDNYTNIPGLSSTPYYLTSGISRMTRSLPVAKKTAVLNTPANKLWDVIYYDDLGRTTNTYAQHYLGGVLNNSNYDAVTTAYNFTNQPTTATRKHWNTNNITYPLITITNWYMYDQLGRKTKTWEQITNLNNAATTRTLVSKIDYNEVGQVLNKHLHSTDSVNFLQNVSYSYNEHGWLLTSVAPLFNMAIYYNTLANKAYNGNIMYQYWGSGGSYTNRYYYSYDKLNRMMSGVFQLLPAGTNLSSEQGIGYDLNGNINNMIRYTGTTTQVLMDNNYYTYKDGSGNQTNQVQNINDLSGNNAGLPNGTTTYTYDGNGNELSATNTLNTGSNKSFTYNLLNLPQTATTPNGTVTYTYDALGNKLRKVSVISGVTKTTEYIAGIEYDGTTTDTLNFIQTEEGKAAKAGNIYDYTYYLGDNLGNTRVTFGTKTGAAVVYQSDDYYPFGMEISNSVASPKNEYLYNKKELQEELNEYDYGARFYDPVIARWTSIDPKAELYQGLAAYVYVADSPLKFIDPNGKEIDVVVKKGDQSETLKYKNGKLYDQNNKEYKGGDKFAAKVLKTLNKLDKIKNATVAKTMKSLETSKLIHAISEVSDSRESSSTGGAAKSDGTPSDGYNGDKVSTNTFINWNDESKEPNTQQSDEDLVGHELYHAYDYQEGKMKGEDITPSAKDPAEIRAVKFENKIRSEEKEKLRTTYGGEPIDRRKLNDPNL
jgi:RHS repeat-associated protein